MHKSCFHCLTFKQKNCEGSKYDANSNDVLDCFVVDTEGLEKLKKEFRKKYMLYHDILDSYDCGRTLAEYINPQLSTLKIEITEVWAKIKELDPNAPDFNW